MEYDPITGSFSEDPNLTQAPEDVPTPVFKDVTSTPNYDFWESIGIDPNTTMENWKSPSNDEIENAILGDYNFAGLIKQYGKSALDLLKTNGKYDPKKLLALGGGLLAANKPSGTTPTGYQGKIPKLTATSNMLTAPPVGRRPGSGGINYGGGVTYRDEAGKVISSNEKTLEELLKAAQENPFNRPSTYENPSYGRPPVSPTPGGGGLPDIAPNPSGVTRPEVQRPPSTGGYTPPPPTMDTSGFVTGAGDTGARFDPFKPSLPEGTTMAMDPTTRVGNTVTTNGVTRGYDPLRGTMFTNAEMQARADAELADRQRRRAEMAAGTYVEPEFSTSSQNTAPISQGTPGFVAPIYNAAVLPPKDQPYVNPYASSLANPATIPLMSGETQEQGAARLKAQSDALEARRAARSQMQEGIASSGAAVGLAKGGLARDGFVVPADVVSHFGNGSSEAGLKLLASKLGATPIKGDGDGMSDSIPTKIDGVQEARVANDEAYVSPEMVAKLGNGSPEKGARKLYAMMDKIRKARTGTTEQGKEIDPNKYMPGGSVQRYAVGGATTPTGATGSESSLSNWAGDYVTNMLGQGAALANKPYEAYTGPLTAGASGLQNQAFNMASNLQTPGSIGQAAGTAGGIANLAANMRYTPQTTDFLGGANMSGLGVAPSYGMGMPQQQPMGTYNNPVPMPRGNDNPKFLGHGPLRTLPYEGDSGITRDGNGREFDAEGREFYRLPDTSVDFGPDPLQKQRPAPADGGMFQTRPMREYGGSQYDPATGIESRDIVKLQPGDPRLEGTNFQTKPFQGVMSEPFMQDGAMTGGVMQAPQAGIPAALPKASQPVGNIAQQYMNPYLESALRPQMAEMQRAADIARMSDAARLTQAGAFGGSRQAIMESEGRRNLLGKQSDALAQGYSTAYDKAMAQFNADQARRAQEAQFGATFGLQGLQTGIQGAQAQAQAGALQSQSDLANLRGTLEAGGVERGIESEGIAADKAQFEEARLNPYKMLQFQQSLLSGMPLASQSYSIPGQSNLQQFAGGATTIAQLLDILSGKTPAAAKP